ncbi:MAG: helix-turn-helix transcriptional regulator [Clostridia bacterium]
MTFGNKLQTLRKQKGLSQEELADILQVSRQAISKWELDETLPEIGKIVAIANYFDVTTDFLINEKENTTENFAENVTIDTEPKFDNFSSESDSSNKNSFNYFRSLIKKKGYIAGYIIAAYFGVGLLVAQFGRFMFRQMMKISGFPGDIGMGGIEELPIIFVNIISVVMLIGVVGGIVLAIVLKNRMNKNDK